MLFITYKIVFKKVASCANYTGYSTKGRRKNKMDDLCYCGNINDLKVEADIGAGAIWCNKCYSNFNIEDFPISIKLKAELQEWILQYGKWIDWNNDGIFPNGVALEEIHNKEGLILTEKVQKELAGKYKVSFSPSTFAKRYANRI